MRTKRAIWLGLNTSACLCLVMAFVLGVVSISVDDWLRVNVKTVNILVEYTQLDRVRGLWRECAVQEKPPNSNVTTGCRYLEPFSDRIGYLYSTEPLLTLRMTQPAVQIVIMILTVIILITVLVMHIYVNINPLKVKPNTVQYTTLATGCIVWLCAFTYFITLIIHFEALAQEAYVYDIRMPNSRSGWSHETRQISVQTLGSMVVLAFMADIMLYLASTSLLTATILTGPPKVIQQTDSLEPAKLRRPTVLQ